MNKRQLQEAWIIEQLKEDNKMNCLTPEIDLRYNFAKRFNVKPSWAYEVIRLIANQNSNIHLEKVEVEEYDGTIEKELAIFDGGETPHIKLVKDRTTGLWREVKLRHKNTRPKENGI